MASDRDKRDQILIEQLSLYCHPAELRSRVLQVEWVRGDACVLPGVMEMLFSLMEEEEDSMVRAVLGH